MATVKATKDAIKALPGMTAMHADGDLVFWDAVGDCIRAFATSAWVGCEQVKKSVHYGYGRAA